MDASVRQRLLQMSADFYRYHTDSFDESRQSYWNSWQRVLKETHALLTPQCVLDLGCGNGRFVSFLRASGYPDLFYVGIDLEEQLIAKARDRHPAEQFEVDDIEHALESSRTFDLVVCFGVFHHLPGVDFRADILTMLSDVLEPGGIAAISLWQPKLLKNFQSKVCINHGIANLEIGDFLLGWKGDFTHLRYCHHFDDAEIDRLLVTCPLKLVTQFQGTGNDRTNRYLILRARSRSERLTGSFAMSKSVNA